MKSYQERLDQLHISYSEETTLAELTTFKVGGAADLVLYPESAEQCTALLLMAKEYGKRLIYLGNGSNMLGSDKGCRDWILKTDRLAELSLDDNGVLYVGAGVKCVKASSFAAKSGFSGMEFAHGIPGTLGGAVFMNAGAYVGSMDQIVKRTFYLNERGEVCILEGEKHDFGYRKSYFMQHPEYLILGTELQLKKGKTEEILALIEDLQQRRRDKQPLEYPSGGSTFKRPEGNFAGKLIEDAGLKGCSVGGAQVSEKHAGFVINYNHATGDDVRALIAHVQAVVKEKFGVTLECEIRFLGE